MAARRHLVRMPKKCQSAGTQRIVAHFPKKSLPFQRDEKRSGFFAVPHGAVGPAFFRHGAMLASAKR
jgi:hypothetical protein